MVAEVEICAAVDTFELLEAEWELEFDVGSCVCIVSELVVIVETVVVSTHTEVDMPLHAVLLPLLKPFHLGARAYEELHLHLLELAHTEDELTCHNLVAEGFSYLCDTEWNLHTASLLDIDIVHEDTLRGLRTEIYCVSLAAYRSELG